MNENKNINLRIRVTNLDTKAVYLHGKVPLEHVEMLRMNKNLKIEVLGQSRGASYERTNRGKEA
jgi:hypothetical protein